MRILRALGCAVALLLATTGCSTGSGGVHQNSTRGTHPSPGSSQPAAEPAAPTGSSQSPMLGDPYVGLAQVLERRGVRIWWEVDLVSAWLGGPSRLRTVEARMRQLGRTPGTAGFKVADELGYHDGVTSPAQAEQFLREARRAVAAADPRAELLIDMIVPQLGCLARTTDAAGCSDDAAASSPAATVDAVQGYLSAGLVDRLDLSAGLLDAGAYPGGDRQAAMATAWREVRARHWDRQTKLQARKALAAPGGYAGDPAADLAVFVDVPVDHGAGAVDLWTWRQPYQGATVGLFPEPPQRGRLWQPLRDRHAAGLRLFTHMTPSTLPRSATALGTVADQAAQVFTDVFVAAGAG